MRLKGLYSCSIFKKLILFSLSISMVPLIVICVIQYVRMQEIMENEIINSHKQVVSQYVQSLNDKMDLFQFQLGQIADNTLVKESLVDDSLNPLERGKRISSEVTKCLALEQNSGVKNCMIYSFQEDTPSYGKNVSMMSVGKKEKWYQIFGELDKEKYVYEIYNETIMSIIKSVYELDTSRLAMEQLGIVKLDIDMDTLFKISQKGGGFKVCVYDESHTSIYQSEKIEEDVLETFFHNKGTKNINHEVPAVMGSYVAYEEFIRSCDLNIVFFFDRTEYNNVVTEIASIILPVVLVLCIFIFIITLEYSKRFSARVAVLLKKIRCVEDGDLSIHDSIKGKDEISMLDKEIDRMTKRLNRLIETNYIQKLENKDIELRNLRLQINPHFLYNTLENVSSIAAVKKVFVICDICERLGEMLRYSLGKNHGEYVTIKQELYHTKNYIYIQQVRFLDRFDVIYRLDDKLMEKKIPRFILQPIVENAIIHGLAWKEEKGTIEISVREESACLVIGIKDDGRGMSQEELEWLREMIDHSHEKVEANDNIGVRNVNQRIKMICGKQYGISVSSILSQGSCFELWLPIL